MSIGENERKILKEIWEKEAKVLSPDSFKNVQAKAKELGISDTDFEQFGKQMFFEQQSSFRNTN